MAVLHHRHPVRRREDVLQPVLRDDDGGAQLPIDFPHGVEKIRRRNGVQLAGRLVKDQHLRLHGHDRRQIQQLLLAAGQLRHVPVEPALNTEIAGHFRHPGPHGFLVAAQTFQPEGQLVPDLVRDDLIVGILHHIADFFRLLPHRHLGKLPPGKQHPAAAAAMGCQHRFQVPQQRRFFAAAAAAEHHILPLLHRQRHVVQRRTALGGGIGKGQIFDFEMFHCMVSFQCNAVGIRRNAV